MENYFAKAENAAHENFSNYNGDEWNNFNDDYNYADGADVSSTALASLPFVINVANSTTTDVTSVNILGSNASLFGATNFGNPAAITITMDNGSITYTEFLQSIISEPFKVGLMYLQSSNTNQPYKQLLITYKESSGRLVQTPITPALDPMQQQTGVTIIRHQFPVNAYTSISTTILASATLTLRLYPSVQLDIARTLAGQSVGKGYSKPNLSQFQLPNGNGLVG